MRPSGRRHRGLPGVAIFAAATIALVAPASEVNAASPPSVFVVAKYPVQAQAGDAVTAKAQALADGQQGAFRSLLKRLVPVTAYKRLPRLPLARVQDMIAGFSVRSERNSSTEYIGSYDFEFQARAVRELLRSSGIATVEETAPVTIVVPVYGTLTSRAAAPVGKGAKATPVAATTPAALPAHFQRDRVAPAWSRSWQDLDTDHALTPVRLAKGSESVSEDTARAVLEGDGGALRALAGSESNDRVVLAYASPSADGRKLAVTLAGRDAVGWFNVTRTYPVLDADVGYAAELASVVGLGIIEGRWKALKASRLITGTVSADGVEGWSTTTDRDDGITTSKPSAGGWTDDIELVVEFRGLGQWQQMRQRLLETPGVEDVEVGQMSARSASVKLRYPGGAERLATDLGSRGLSLDNQGGSWVLQSR